MTVTAPRRGFSLRSIFSHFLKRRREVRSMQSLMDLPDSVLADIGLTRFDVRAAVYSSWRDTPSACLVRVVGEKQARQEAANDALTRAIVDQRIAA